MYVYVTETNRMKALTLKEICWFMFNIRRIFKRKRWTIQASNGNLLVAFESNHYLSCEFEPNMRSKGKKSMTFVPYFLRRMMNTLWKKSTFLHVSWHENFGVNFTPKPHFQGVKKWLVVRVALDTELAGYLAARYPANFFAGYPGYKL